MIDNFPARQPSAILYEALWYRDGYGVAAVEAIRQHPWTGVGVGTYNGIQVDYHPPRSIISSSGQCAELLAAGARRAGHFGVFAVVALTLSTVRLLLRRVQAAPLLASTLKATIIGLGLALMFGVPTQNAAIAVTAATIIGWLQRS